MKVILEIPQENLERLGELAKFQKRSRKSFMELVLINHAESAKDGSPEYFGDFVINTLTKKEVSKKQAKNASAVKIQNLNTTAESNYSVDNFSVKEAIIEKLTKAVISCSDTPLGRKAKAHYQRQIDELKK